MYGPEILDTRYRRVDTRLLRVVFLRNTDACVRTRARIHDHAIGPEKRVLCVHADRMYQPAYASGPTAKPTAFYAFAILRSSPSRYFVVDLPRDVPTSRDAYIRAL